MGNHIFIIAFLIYWSIPTHVQIIPNIDYDEGITLVLKQDTIVNGQTFNTIKYYSTGEIKALANSNPDSSLTGKCFYYKRDGNKLAKGQFSNNHATGLWWYYNYRKEKIDILDWAEFAEFKIMTRISIENNEEIVYQVVLWEHGVKNVFRNGLE